MPCFSDDKGIEHQDIQYSSFSLTNTTGVVGTQDKRMLQEILTKHTMILNNLFPLKSWWLLKHIPRAIPPCPPPTELYLHYLPQARSQGNKNYYILDHERKYFSCRNICLLMNDKKANILSRYKKTTTKNHHNVIKKSEVSLFTYNENMCQYLLHMSGPGMTHCSLLQHDLQLLMMHTKPNL